MRHHKINIEITFFHLFIDFVVVIIVIFIIIFIVSSKYNVVYLLHESVYNIYTTNLTLSCLSFHEGQQNII